MEPLSRSGPSKGRRPPDRAPPVSAEPAVELGTRGVAATPLSVERLNSDYGVQSAAGTAANEACSRALRRCRYRAVRHLLLRKHAIEAPTPMRNPIGPKSESRHPRSAASPASLTTGCWRRALDLGRLRCISRPTRRCSSRSSASSALKVQTLRPASDTEREVRAEVAHFAEMFGEMARRWPPTKASRPR